MLPKPVWMLLCMFAVVTFHPGCSSSPDRPGLLEGGATLLPNGWKLTPAGRHAAAGDLPLNMLVTPDGRYTFALNSGHSAHSITVLDNTSWTVHGTTPVAKTWVGMQLFNGGSQLLVSGGNNNCVYLYDVLAGILSRRDSITLDTTKGIWTAGLDIDQRSGQAFVTARGNDRLYLVDLAARSVLRSIPLPARPYTCLVSLHRPVLYVSLWGGASVLVIDRTTLRTLASYPTGEHPNEILESPDGTRLFVANANHNTVTVINAVDGRIQETLSAALTPDAPYGSTPNSLALTPDGTRLYIANADNNCLAVMDVSRPGQSTSLGFIPTGWYPTSVRIHHPSGDLLVANGKGAGSMANPQGPNPERGRSPLEQYIGSLFRGTISRIPAPDTKELAAMSARVYANSPLTSRKAARRDEGNPIPDTHGEPSPIKHVFYIIKENRTYDQVFGDMPEGNGDPSLCLFPEEVTPNHHALAREFVLLDNLYCDAEVSTDGHNWSMGAYATDYVEKSWPTLYGGRGGEYDYEGGHPIAAPSGGYIWDACLRNGVTYRSYGEFAVYRSGSGAGDTVRATVPALVGNIAPHYRGYDLDYADVDRAAAWQKEFDEYDRNGRLPQFQVIRLPNDHTAGTRRGKPTPRAYVADNDLALGLIVERISRSRYWKKSAIFVIEDDAQNGPDHVDAHRTVALVVSPWTKRGFVDSEMYSTSSMLRTMELILGLPPMSQFDDAATPMVNAFTATPDTTPYTHRAARIDLGEKNLAGAYGQERCEEMNFAQADAIPDVELSEILWKAIRGAHSPMPPPVRSAFVRVVDGD